MVAVVLVADDHDVSRLADRLVTPRVGRLVRVQDDPRPEGLDQEGRVTVPGDAHCGETSFRSGTQPVPSPFIDSNSLSLGARASRLHSRAGGTPALRIV